MVTVTATKTALLEALGTRAGLAGVSLIRGVPQELPQTDASLYLLGTESFRRRRDGHVLVESYDLRLLLEVHGLADQQAVEARMWAVLAEVEQEIADNPEFGEHVTESEFALRSEESGYVGSTWLARAEAVVSVEAWAGVGDA